MRILTFGRRMTTAAEQGKCFSRCCCTHRQARSSSSSRFPLLIPPLISCLPSPLVRFTRVAWGRRCRLTVAHVYLNREKCSSGTRDRVSSSSSSSLSTASATPFARIVSSETWRERRRETREGNRVRRLSSDNRELIMKDLHIRRFALD